MSKSEGDVRYPLSDNELGILLHTIEWLTRHLSDIITLLGDRHNDEELLNLAKSAHGHLNGMLKHLRRHYASLGTALEPRKKEKIT